MAKHSNSSILLRNCGGLLVAFGLAHLLVWFFADEPWEGAVSWRKPTLFGISGGLTLISLGYVQRLLRPWRSDLVLASLLTVSMSAEILLISFQQWRGVSSHFNWSTPLNSAIDIAITTLIVVVFGCMLMICTRALRGLNTTADWRLAWMGGLFYLMVSSLVGFLILGYGILRTRNGLDPAIWGAEGVVKFPHGMAIHAIQALPLVCWLLQRAGVEQTSRLRAIWAANAGVGMLLLFSVVQTLSGKARSDVGFVSGAILIVACLCLGFAVLPVLKSIPSKVWPQTPCEH